MGVDTKESNVLESLTEKPLKTSIIILSYNQFAYSQFTHTKLCIDNIHNNTEDNTYEIIVVDNNSQDGTKEWLRQQKDIKVIYNEQNLAFPKACNQGIKIATGTEIVILKSDTIVTKEWLKNLRLALYSDKCIGAVGPVTNACSFLYYQTISVSYSNIQEMHEFAQQYNKHNPQQWEDRLKLAGYCLLVKKSVINEIGLFDEIFPGDFENDDYSLRIINAGYRLVLCKDTFIHNSGLNSFKEQKYISLFEEKWGFNPNYSILIRREIISLIDKPSDTQLNVLEVGCACGGTLLQIKNMFNKANLYGIELNEKAAAIAKNVAHVVAADIEDYDLEYDEHYFDYIILADVLEHLRNPWQVLKKLKKHLKPGGCILASIPNVMHFSVIRNLINGKWTYENAGILDITHLRFFTLHEINKMFNEAGYEIKEYFAIKLPKTPQDTEFLGKLMSYSNEVMSDQYEAFQYIIKAS